MINIKQLGAAMIRGYVRVSTQGQANDGVSLEAQQSKIEAWADLNGYTPEEIQIYSDVLSGKAASNRPGLQAALSDCKKGDVVIVFSLSRLARSTKDAIAISEKLDKGGVDLVSISEKIDTTSAAGKMVFRMMAVLAEFERDQIAERTKAALDHKKAKGEKTGGDVPFGYKVDEAGKLHEDGDEQETIALINDLKAKGHSLRAIGAALEQRGIKTKRGLSKWNPKTVNAIIKRIDLKKAA